MHKMPSPNQPSFLISAISLQISSVYLEMDNYSLEMHQAEC